MKIAVRGGHNYKIRGADGFVDEVEVDREYYILVIKYLRLQGHEVLDVTPYSTDTKSQDLSYGVSRANSWGADLFISCHVNSSNGEGHGVEVLHHKNSTKGKDYATQVATSISKLGFKLRNTNGSKADTRGLYELNKTKMAAIIIEPFFLDNKTDVDIYKKIGADSLAKAIVKGITGKEVAEMAKYDENPPKGANILPNCKKAYMEETGDGRFILHMDRGNYIALGKGECKIYLNDNNGHEKVHKFTV